jgi:SAM-dependent methyltransferase
MEESKRLRALQFVQNSLQFGEQTVMPLHMDRYLMAFADEEFGQNWVESPDVFAILSSGMSALESFRTAATPPVYDLSSAIAYLFGHGPLHFHKVPFLLRNLLRKQSFKNQLRVLDLGAGAGVASLSTIYFFELLACASRIATGAAEEFHLRMTPLDSVDETLQIYHRLIQNYTPFFPEVTVELGSPIHSTLTTDADALADMFGNEKFDLVLASHVLGEMRTASITGRARLVRELGKLLEPEGAILFVESASGAITSEMNQLKSRAVAEGLNLFHPCSTAWEKPSGRQCYSCGNAQFDRVRKPLVAEILSTLLETYNFDALAEKNLWTYGILRNEEAAHHPILELASGLFTKIADLQSHLDKRVSLYGAIARQETARVDNSVFFKLCDQSSGSDFACIKFAPELGTPFLEIGDVLELEEVLVQAAKGGKNKVTVLVDGQTRVRNLSRDYRHLPSKHVLTPEVLG